MNKTIGLFAHVDAGKTTLAEQILFLTKSIKHKGRVDHKDAYLDNHEIEKKRGITVFSEQGNFIYNDSQYYLIDTPGHVDFSPEMERAIQVMDYAIVVISAVEGVEGHTETVWNLLSKHNIPTFFFINKIDRIGADINRVIEDISTTLSEDVCDITDSLQRDKMSNELIEFIAERDEKLLEQYLEKGYEFEVWLSFMKNLIKENKIFPSFSGSALENIGVEDFLEKLDLLTMTNYLSKEPFAGRIYKIRHDENNLKITFIKALKGNLNVRDMLSYGDSDSLVDEKVTQIRVYNGNKYMTKDQATAGELFAITGLSNTTVGQGLGTLKDKAVYEIVPTLKSKVILKDNTHVKEAIRSFKLLEEEDPSLQVIWDEVLKEIYIHVLGMIQLEVLEQVVKERFHFTVSFGEAEIIYKETITTDSIGYGHFEPLGHYAEVHLKLEPRGRNSGIFFENACHPDDLSIGHQNLIRHHIFEKPHHGILTGSMLTDIKVTLLTGRAHNRHTSGGDFREATYRALRQGLEKIENILLEPYYDFRIKVDIDDMGKVLTDIQIAHGSFDTPKTIGTKAIITGKAPVATFMKYPTKLAAITQGKGSINLVFGGYYQCHNEKEVITRVGYNKNADPNYTSFSIFCSKGQSYSVKGEEAESKMHGL